MADVDAAVVRQRTTKARFVQPNDEGSDKLNVQVLLDGSWVAGTTDSLSTEDVQVNVGPTQHTVSRTKIRRPVKAERTHQQKQDAHAEVRERKDARERRLSAAAAERAEEAKETDHNHASIPRSGRGSARCNPKARAAPIGDRRIAHHHVCTDIGARLRTLAQSGLGAYKESAGQVLLPSTNSGSLGGIVTGTTQVRRS